MEFPASMAMITEFNACVAVDVALFRPHNTP
ncbi:hypothetical protein COLO4_16874 [Corchorus olitorius]|uniref:Uncharacterized protein n=1 Tax=Corchorus olitorius TaxID=93759 RepID=A0A1R3JF54_9ROSI|nr:hypothetical protein COLO4_16874 [Corchorus olitorius]